MKKCLLVLLLCFSVNMATAQQTQKILKKVIISHFFSCALDQMLDTLTIVYHIPIVFERDSMNKMDIVERFFEEPLKNVLKKVCKDNSLHYWIENDGTIYILQQPDDLERLKQLNILNKTAHQFTPKRLEPAKGPPQYYNFAMTGRIIDQLTGEALPSATIKVRGTDQTTLSNKNGNFTLLRVPSDTAVLEVSMTGYQPDFFRLNDTLINKPVQLGLFPSFNALNEVVIKGKKAGVLNSDSKKVSALQLSPAALDKIPNIGERDIMRAFQLMPGVSGTNESSSGAYVRGGTPDQNLVLFDGFTVYEVDHLYGFFSAFNSNAVRDVEMYKGGFSAKYGGRLSSVTEIIGKDGNKNETNIGGEISLLSANIYAESPVGSKSSFLIAYRHSYQGPLYDKIFGQFNASTTGTAGGPPGGGPGGGGPGGRGGGFANQTTPSSYFDDLNARYSYRLSANNSFTWTYYGGADNTQNNRSLSFPFQSSLSSNNIQINDYNKTANIGTSLKWVSTWGSKLFSSTAINYSSYSADRDRGTTGSVTDSGITRNINNGTLETNRLRDLGIKSDWEWQAGSGIKLRYGGFASSLRLKYNYTQNDTTTVLNQQGQGITGGTYTELEFDPNDKLHLVPGLRETYFTPTGRFYTEPRLSATYKLTDNLNLKGATGRFYQFTNRVTREDILSGNRNFWVLSNKDNIPVGAANHFIAGFSYETSDYLLDVEGYHKKLSGLTEYSISQQGGGGATGGGPGGGFNSVSTTTLTQRFYNGVGYADGLEVLLQKKAGKYTGWLSYTLGQAKSQFNAFGSSYFSSDQDVRHELKSVNMYHLQRWSFAAIFIFSTGHPYTAPLSSYTVTRLDGTKTTFLAISGMNQERLPDYHRLDLSATYDLLKIDGKKVGSVGLSLFNVYNHINSWYKEYSVQNNQVITTNVNYLGFTPNLTLSLKWK